MAASRSLVAPTSNPRLQQALAEKLLRRQDVGGSVGELEPLAIRIGLMQRTLKPSFHDPQLLVFAADHGIAVDGLQGPGGRSTADVVRQLLGGQLPLSVFARSQRLACHVVDCGVAEDLQGNDRLLARKIAHGTRNAHMSSAMSVEQAHAGMRAGMEIGDKLRGNATVLAGVGVGAHESASLVLARLTDSAIRDLIISGPDMDTGRLTHLMAVTMGAMARHRDITEPVEVLAAFGGFEVAVMMGVMLMAASKRHVLLVDGLPACAALMLASRIAQPVTDYCVFTRSHPHKGLDKALSLFRSTALMELGLDSVDGTGATLAWPLVSAAAALLAEVADGEDPGPAWPAGLSPEDEEPSGELFPGEQRLY